MLYVSTSRKPTSKTRILAKWLERLLGGESENRGKRSVSDIAGRMGQKGFKRAVFVYERHGNPFSLNFLDVDDGWLYPEVLIGEYSFPEKAGKRVPYATSAEAKDAKGKKILEMMGFENAEVDDGLNMRVNENELAFYEGKTKVFSLKIKGFREAREAKKEDEIGD